jgi:hypothetical protein
VRVLAQSGVPGGQFVDLELNGGLALHRDVAAGDVLELDGYADPAGRAVLRFSGPPPHRGGGLRVGRVEVLGSEAWSVPVRRLAGYAALVVLALLFCAWGRLTVLPTLAVLGAVAGVAVLGIVRERVLVLGRLESFLAVLTAALLLAALARRLGLRTGFAALLALSAAFRLLCTLEPAFPAIDETFHSHRIAAVQRGRLVTSAVAGARPGTILEIPYPPGFHVMLAPFVPRGDARAGRRAVRLALAFFEGTAPLLLFLIARRGGADELAAGLAAVCGSVMPEALLVVGKGIAANVAGSWVGLLAVLTLLSNRSPVTMTATLALGFLVHPGAAASLGGLATTWLLWRWWKDGSTPLGQGLGVVAAAAAVAFLVYFREVLPLTLRGLAELQNGTAAAGRGLLRVEWIHLGKLIQNLVLKFGGGPLWLAGLGLGRAPEPLRTLLQAWLGVAATLALLAVFGPVALRFEYFAAPAVALAAGCGGAHLWRTGRRRAVVVVLALALLLQVVLGVLLLEGRFVLRNVIIPSERWPMMEALGRTAQ